MTIHHVTRVVPPVRLDECVEFYGLLGFRRIPAPDGIAGRAVWLERMGSQIHLMPIADAAVEQGHVAVVVEGYEGALERLRARGVEVQPRAEHWGSPRAFVRDPAGNTVELMAWPPGASGPGGAHWPHETRAPGAPPPPESGQ